MNVLSARAVGSETVKMLHFTLCVFDHNFKKLIYLECICAVTPGSVSITLILVILLSSCEILLKIKNFKA